MSESKNFSFITLSWSMIQRNREELNGYQVCWCDPVCGVIPTYPNTLHSFQGGYVDSTHQHLVLLFMALGQMDVSKVVLGPLTQYRLV